jgi:hypothetical protein
MRSVLLGVMAVAFGGVAACYIYEEPPTPAAPSGIGPAPLRRLSNLEYTNALGDLFPSVHVALPTMPADVPVAGFENAAEAQQASDVLVSRYEAIANLYAEALTKTPDGVRSVTGCNDWSTPALVEACTASFLSTTGKRVFRRPLTNAERDRFALRFQGWASAVDFEGAVQLTLSALLQSPQFLYRPEAAAVTDKVGTVRAVDSYAMASRLSFFLWESVPDDALLASAERGELATATQVRDAAERMLADPRGQRVLWDFPRQWLGLDRILLDEHAVRAPDVDPLWTEKTEASASRETELFVRNTLAAGGTLRDLLTSRKAWVDGETSRLYGLPAPLDPSAWTETELPGDQRAGLLTRASFLAGYSHRGATSPPVRSNGIDLHLFCQTPISPPPGADLSQPMAAPGDGPKTNRMLFEQRTQPAACQSCHKGLNALGFGFENYDAAGRYRTSDNGLPIDASGHITGTDVDRDFNGALELSQWLAQSETVHRCATDELVRYALGRAPSSEEEATVRALAKAFVASGGDLRALLLDVATSPTFRMRIIVAPSAGEGGAQ